MPNNELIEQQVRFDGAWLPDVDPAMMGANNFRTLRNLRYKNGYIEGVLGYTKINTTALTTYTNIVAGHQLRSDRTQQTYVLVQAQDTSGNGRVYQNQTAIPSQGDFEATHLHSDASANLSGRFSEAPQGHAIYCNGEESMIWGGEEQRLGAFFLVDDASLTNPVEYTDEMNNVLQSTGNTVSIGTKLFYVVMSTRPLQGVKVYVKTANGTTSSLTAKYWNGSSFTAVSSLSDGTASGGITHAQTGVISFDSTVSGAAPRHFEGYYLYAYLFELSAGTCTAYNFAVDAPFQDVIDIWDGVYRQPVQAQFKTSSSSEYQDFTLHVNEASYIDTPIGMEIDSMTSTGEIVYIFEERVAGIYHTILPQKGNSNAATLTAKYWDGSAWQSLTITDGTSDGSNTMNQSGLVSWNPPAVTAEKKRTLWNTNGYAYQLTVSATLDADVIVDLVTAVPAQKTVRPFNFASQYKNRVLLCGYNQGREGQRVDFSLTNAPDVWNGDDTSNAGIQSLNFGGNDYLICGAELYNRFGSSIFSVWIGFKKGETYLLNGDGPEDYTIYPVSKNIGCPAPNTLAAAEVGYELAQDVRRNVIIWMSYSGPMLFDGAAMMPLEGIENFFDPTKDEYINTTYIHLSQGWYDHTYKEYNLQFPTGSSTTLDKWVAYDLRRKKWYEKNVGSANMPQCGFSVMDTLGIRYIYAGTTTGYMMRLENGPTWDGTGITYHVFPGDFWPSESVWHQTRIRYLIFMAIAIPEDITVAINYYGDTSSSSGLDVSWVDTTDVEWTDTTDVEWASAAASLLDLSTTGDERVNHTIEKMNKLGWAHAFEFKATTTTTSKGFQPLGWGYIYRVERRELGN